VLLTANGCGTAEIMHATGKAKTVIWRWQQRFRDEGSRWPLAGQTRRSAFPLSPEVANVWSPCVGWPPAGGQSLDRFGGGKTVGISVSSVQRIWRAHGLQPHRMRQSRCPTIRSLPPNCTRSSASTSTRPTTPLFVGHEKSQIQALNRTQPGCRMKKGRLAHNP